MIGEEQLAGVDEGASPFVTREAAFEAEPETYELAEHETWLERVDAAEDETTWFSEHEEGAAETDASSEQYELEDEETSIVGRIRNAVGGGLWSLAVELAITAGERDEKKLTNLVFRARHPELGGRPIRGDETALAAEWLTIRDTLVRPALRRRVGGRAAVTRSQAQRLGTQTLRQAWASYRCNEAEMVPLQFLGRRTKVNRLTVDAFRALSQALESTGYRASSAGCFVCRKIRGSENWSLHAYGLAMDIDPGCNPHRVGYTSSARLSDAASQDARCADVRANRADTNFTPEQIAAAESIRTVDGLRVFTWAGHWRRSPDAMHFQIDVTPAELSRGLATGGAREETSFAAPPLVGESFADEIFRSDSEAEPVWGEEESGLHASSAWLSEAMAEADEALWEAPSAGRTSGGRLEVDQLPLLAAHRGTRPDLVLRWNAMSAPASIDVVVHFHGYSGDRERMRLQTSKEPRSGLDLVSPPGGGPGRERPTLAVLPRGNYFGGRYGIGYNFPALTRPGALRTLVQEALDRFGAHTGVRAPLGRLILTGHSGGGAPIMAILRHEDPDEVHTFDALYGSPDSLIAWARKRIARDLAEGSPSGALRVIYRGGEPTDANSQKVRRAICTALARTGDARITNRYRVERTRVGHNDVPARFGGALLADAGADLAGVVRQTCPGASLEAESWEVEQAFWETADESSGVAGDWIAPRRADLAAPRELDEDEAWLEEAALEAAELGETGEETWGTPDGLREDGAEAWLEGSWGEAGWAETEQDESEGHDETWEESAVATLEAEVSAELDLAEHFSVEEAMLAEHEEPLHVQRRVSGQLSNRAAGTVRLEPFRQCTTGAQPGAEAMARQWRRLTGRRSGIHNCRKTEFGNSSLHGEGRAIDLAANANDRLQKQQADAYVEWLIANAVEIQCATLIWNGRIWSWAHRTAGWRPYGGKNKHRDHIHVNLTWEGALEPSRLLDGSVPGLAGGLTPQPQPAPQPQPTPPPRPTRRIPPNVLAFYGSYRGHAAQSEQATGVPSLVTLGQAAVESGWGKHAPRFNFFGIKARASDPEESRQLLRTKEVLRSPDIRSFPEVISVTPRPDGKYDYVVRDWFRAYPSATDAFLSHGRLLRNGKRYAGAWAHVGDPYAFIRAVAQAGYATGPSYAEAVSAAMRLLERAAATST